MSLNDPQWGKRSNQSGGPPDLDEIWRNVNRRMNDLFGRKREPQDGGERQPGTRPADDRIQGIDRPDEARQRSHDSVGSDRLPGLLDVEILLPGPKVG